MIYSLVGFALLFLLLIAGVPIVLIIWSLRRKAKTGEFPWVIFLVVFVLYFIGLAELRFAALSMLGVTGNRYGVEQLDGNISPPITNDSAKNPTVSTSGNLIFTDNRGNFSFEYPYGYTDIKSVDPTPIDGTSFQAKYLHSYGDDNGEVTWFIQVVTAPLPPDFDPKQEIAKNKANYDLNYQNVSNIYIAGEMAIQYDNPGSTATRIVEFYHGGLSYQIAFSGIRNNLLEDKEINDAIALVKKTFTFLR